ncbi:MAG: hypothetical protein RIC85_01375 [Gammaproteobacteria bacterium]
MKLKAVLFATSLILLTQTTANAEPLTVELQSEAGNPASPQMGDNLSFHTTIRNNGTVPIEGLIAWISLVQIDKGKEQPVDLEDWSAHKAVTLAALAPGQSLQTEWPMRLIQSGTYRVVVSGVSRDDMQLRSSPFLDFTVRQKPVVESQRVLPIAIGIPFLIGAGMLWRRRWTQSASA